jgi:hypothetical protein
MREDYLETLDKMFPKGYVIVYTFENNDNMHCHFYNPYRYEALLEYRDLILDHGQIDD